VHDCQLAAANRCVRGLFRHFQLDVRGAVPRSAGSIAILNPPGYAGAFSSSAVETLATVGYGDMAPQSTYGQVVASIQIFLGTGVSRFAGGDRVLAFFAPRGAFS